MKKLNRPYVRTPERNFTPVYLPGEDYSFYVNSDEILSDAGVASFELRVITSHGVYVTTIPGLTALYAYGGTAAFDLYIQSFIFPMLFDGYYYFQIYNTAVSLEVFRSLLILVSNDCLLVTTPVKFRHNDVLYGIRYDLLPDFFQKFRLPLNQIKAPEVRSDRTQYRQASEGRELRNTKSFRDIVLTVEMYWAADDDYEALSAMLEHECVYISGNKLILLTQVRTDKPNEWSNLSKGTFEVIVDDYDLDVTSFEYYGDFIFWGGTTYDIFTTFIDGGTP